jgi:hypothetical protein
MNHLAMFDPPPLVILAFQHFFIDTEHRPDSRIADAMGVQLKNRFSYASLVHVKQVSSFMKEEAAVAWLISVGFEQACAA